MRKSTVILCLLFVAAFTLQAKERVINTPSFAAWSGRSIEIEKITLSENETVLDIHAFYMPNYWIKFVTETYLVTPDGTKYPIKGSEGLTLNEEFWMPESGEAKFKLIFPPLPDSVSEVDMIEEVERGYMIWGIQLKENALPKVTLPAGIGKHDYNKNTSLPTPELKVGKATLKGELLGYKPEMNTEVYLHAGDLTGIFRSENIKVNPDGTFQTEIDLLSPMHANVYFGDLISVFLAPGETTMLYINLPEACRKQSRLRKDEPSQGKLVYATGYLGALTEEYNENKHICENGNEVFEAVKDMDLPGIKQYLLSLCEKRKREIPSLNVSNACKELLQIETEVTALMDVMSTKSFYVHSMLQKGEIKREDANNYYVNLSLPENFYDDIGQFTVINTPKAVYGSTFSVLLNQPEVPAVLTKTLGTDKGIYFDAVASAGIFKNLDNFVPLTDTDRETLKNISSPAYLEIAEMRNNELLKKMEANKKKSGFRVNATGEVENEDLFASIISKFAGKAILVDFWATWCGPCIMANKEMIPMKEELKDEDIVYLYIAGEDSPEKTWENMIPDIHGEHFRVNKEQWEYLRKNFGVSGVPTYLVVNREGNITFKNTGFPGAEKMKNELTKALNN